MWRRRLQLPACAAGVLVVLALLVPSGSGAQAHAATSVVHAPVLHVQTLAAAGTTFAFAELGTGAPLLLLNGTASPMSEWDPVLLDRLSRRARVIVLDYPGLGLSGAAPGAWTFEAAAGWIAAFLEQREHGAAVDVLGWSMGGFIAQRLVASHPRLVHRLILAGTNPGGSRAVLGPAWAQRADSQAQQSDASYLASNYPRTRSAQAAGRAFLDRLDQAVRTGAYPQEEVPARTQRAMVAAEDPWLRSDANARQLAQIRVRTLVITGADDVITPPVNSRRIAALIPHSMLTLVPGSGHSFLFQEPVAVAARLHAFLAEG